MKPLTKEAVEMMRQGLLNSEWCGFSKRDTVNQLCDLALKSFAPPEERAPKAKEYRAHGLTPELVMEHYPQTQHQPDECQICCEAFEVAAEALRNAAASSPQKTTNAT